MQVDAGDLHRLIADNMYTTCMSAHQLHCTGYHQHTLLLPASTCADADDHHCKLLKVVLNFNNLRW